MCRLSATANRVTENSCCLSLTAPAWWSLHRPEKAQVLEWGSTKIACLSDVMSVTFDVCFGKRTEVVRTWYVTSKRLAKGEVEGVAQLSRQHWCFRELRLSFKGSTWILYHIFGFLSRWWGKVFFFANFSQVLGHFERFFCIYLCIQIVFG